MNATSPDIAREIAGHPFMPNSWREIQVSESQRAILTTIGQDVFPEAKSDTVAMTARSIIAWVLLRWAEIAPSYAEEVALARKLPGGNEYFLWAGVVKDPAPFTFAMVLELGFHPGHNLTLLQILHQYYVPKTANPGVAAATVLRWAMAHWNKVAPRFTADLAQVPSRGLSGASKSSIIFPA